MPNYKKMYFALFNAVTDSISSLQKAQQDGEEAYMETESPLLPVLIAGAPENCPNRQSCEMRCRSVKSEKKKHTPEASGFRRICIENQA